MEEMRYRKATAVDYAMRRKRSSPGHDEKDHDHDDDDDGAWMREERELEFVYVCFLCEKKLMINWSRLLQGALEARSSSSRGDDDWTGIWTCTWWRLRMRLYRDNFPFLPDNELSIKTSSLHHFPAPVRSHYLALVLCLCLFVRAIIVQHDDDH